MYFYFFLVEYMFFDVSVLRKYMENRNIGEINLVFKVFGSVVFVGS